MSAACQTTDDSYINTTVRLPRATLMALRRAAVERAMRDGSRFSVSSEVALAVAKHLVTAPAANGDDDERHG